MERQLNDIVSRLGRIEGKQDAALEYQNRLDADITGQSARISELEKGQSRMMGYGAGVAGLFSFILAVFR